MNSMPDEPDDLRDEHLWRALAHAPDHSAVPDWRLRKAILRRAHDAIGATDPDTDAAELERAARPWWRRAADRGGKDARRTRMPWRAAVATVLLAVLAGLLWQREHVLPGRVVRRCPGQRRWLVGYEQRQHLHLRFQQLHGWRWWLVVVRFHWR